MAYNVEPFYFKISLYKLSKVQLNHFILDCIIKIDKEKNCYKRNIIFVMLI